MRQNNTKQLMRNKMSRVNAVNQSFSDLYKKLGKFSYAPYGWELLSYDEVGDDVWGLTKIILEIPIKIALTPILLPATAVTFSLAALGALIVASSHLFNLAIAALADCLDPEPYAYPTPRS